MRKVTIADTITAMKKNGIEVSEKDAEVILDFLYLLAKLAVDDYFKEQDKPL